MATDHERFMRIALEEAAQGGAEGNIAVGSVVVRGDSLVGRGHNKATSNNDPTAHAETDALRNAGASARQVDFSGCTLYTTFEPCPMCCGAIMSSRISTVVMGARYDPAEGKWGSYTVEALIKMVGRDGSVEIVTGILPQECQAVRDEWEG